MEYYVVKIQKDFFCIEILNLSQSISAVYFIGISGLIIFLLPIVIIFILSMKVSFGTFIIFLLSWIIAGYFFRLYLWNKYGREVVLIKQNNLERYYDYKLFKDNRESYDFSKIEILYFIENTGFVINDEGLSHYSKLINELSVIGFDLDGKIITSFKEIPISDIVDISQKWRSWVMGNVP